MGVAGVAALYAVVSLFKFIAAFMKWLSWKSRGVSCDAMVVGIFETQENYKGRKGVTYHRYRVAVDYQDKQPMTVYPIAVYEKIVPSNVRNEVAVGKQLRVLYNPITGVCTETADLKSGITSNLAMLAVSVAIFFLCFLLVEAIG